MSDLAQRVCSLLEENSIGKVTKTRTIDSLGLDSLEFVSVLHDLEAEFDIKIGVEALANCVTVTDIAALIQSKC